MTEDKTRTSVQIPTEMHQYVANHDNLSFTQLMQDAIASRMGSDDEAERIRSELEDKREEREELEDKLDQLDAQINVLEDRLDALEESKEAPYDDLIDELSRVKRKMDNPWEQFRENRQKRLQHVADTTDIDVTAEEVQACLDYAIDWEYEEARLGMHKVAPDEGFTDEEEERARNFLQD